MEAMNKVIAALLLFTISNCAETQAFDQTNIRLVENIQNKVILYVISFCNLILQEIVGEDNIG